MNFKKIFLFIFLIPLIALSVCFSLGRNSFNKNIYNDSSTENNFINNNEDLINPYIESDGFLISGINLTEESISVMFGLTIVGDWSAPSTIDITLKNNDDEYINLTANRINEATHVINTEINEVQYGYQISQGLEQEETYTFYSLNNTNLAVENNGDNIDSEIILNGDLNLEDNKLIFNTDKNNNPYILKKSFKREKVSYGNAIFSFVATSNWIIHDYIDVRLKSVGPSGGVAEVTKKMYFINYEDLNDGTYKFYYEFNASNFGNGINDHHYRAWRLLNTYLAVGNSESYLDDSIDYSSDLEEEIDTITWYFESPYITSFSLGDSIINNSIQFEINVINNRYNDFDKTEPLNLTLKNLDNDEIYNLEATYVRDGNTTNSYVYEINNLIPGTNYEIISIDNAWLTIGNKQNYLVDNILLEDYYSKEELSFYVPYDNPYIEKSESSFKINSWTDTTVTYTIVVENWENPKQEIEVSFLGNSNNLALEETKTYTSYLINEDEETNKYTYEIRGLDDQTTYTFYSLNNTGIAVGDNADNVSKEEILLTNDLGIDVNNLTFKTNKTKVPVWIISLIIILIIFILIILIVLIIKYLSAQRKKGKKELEKFNNENL